MFCNECGAQNVDGAKFCNSCGHQLHTPVIPVERTESPEFYKCYDFLKTFGKDSVVPDDVKEKAEKMYAINNENAVVEETKQQAQPVVNVQAASAPVSTPVTEVKAAEENPLAKLSTYKSAEKITAMNNTAQRKVASSSLDPIEDDYWDDTLKEIDDEIYSIPRENIIKVVGSVVALLAVIAWFIYMT